MLNTNQLTVKGGDKMKDKIALRMMRCPKCGNKHIDEFDGDTYWFLCRDCGYNCPVYYDEAEAITAFCNGVIRRDITPAN